MPLFRERPIRSIAAVATFLLAGHYITKIMSSLHAYHLTQTSVAILAISSLMFLVTMHHRREGHLLSQSQEEMVLICGLGLLWMVALLAWRGLYKAANPGRDVDLPMASSDHRHGRSVAKWVYPCASDDGWCTVEDYEYF